jgi:hypothetical protein
MFAQKEFHDAQACDISDILSVVKPDRPTEVAISAGVLPKLLHTIDQTQGPEQIHENDIAKVIIVCEPVGASLMMGALHPRASLFERCVWSNHFGARCVRIQVHQLALVV